MIEVEKLTKHYGNFIAIEDVSFHVGKGEIIGFLGPNGAGKTTTMRILTGFMPPTDGTAKIAGYDVVDQSLEARRRIGYLPESVPLYRDMTVNDYLEFSATLKGIPRDKRRGRIEDAIERVKVWEYEDTHIGKLSKGYRQRVGIAQAILHEPDVLILDEPTIGIDPIQITETRQLIKDLGKAHTILISTHILPEVSMVCERVVIINEGRIVAEDRPENLSARLRGTERLEVEAKGPSRQIERRFQQIKGVREIERDEQAEGACRFIIDHDIGSDIRQEVATVLVQNNWSILSLRPMGLSLEDIFLRLTTREEGVQA